MLHDRRLHSVLNVLSAEDLASRLTGKTWCLCIGFRLGDLLFLNDATSEDGAPEWAVMRPLVSSGLPGVDDHHPAIPCVQVESITFGWMTLASALDTIQRLQDGRLCTPMGRYTLKLDHPAGPCAHCA